MATVLPKDTARRITAARKLGDISSRQLSLLADTADGFAAAIERGQAKSPAFGVISRFALVLGVSLDWLARGDGPEPTKEQVLAAVENARLAHEKATKKPRSRKTKVAA